ncbi:hypothetical protein [Rhizobium phage RHph_X3_2]|nr:hypothetical protein [Rhizobium phage RHph_X3_2]
MTPEEKSQVMVAKANLDAALGALAAHNANAKIQRAIVPGNILFLLSQAQGIMGALTQAEVKKPGYRSMGK